MDDTDGERYETCIFTYPTTYCTTQHSIRRFFVVRFNVSVKGCAGMPVLYLPLASGSNPPCFAAVVPTDDDDDDDSADDETGSGNDGSLEEGSTGEQDDDN